MTSMDNNIQAEVELLTKKLNTEISTYYALIQPPVDFTKAIKVVLHIQILQQELNLQLEKLYAGSKRSHLSVVKKEE
jgi:hypothetical protein